ncbi:PREDICTED: uncharacterized protein LOC104824221 isoform X2 [Tarenaya hassleriana]|uniref:uncharacterized protein LOC104824221 isoform X2 n=1 Tax=Tarenaya hassleriana TaxID=28532 RepID=UPI00053C4E0E|nr:PREDICTED: uncharacterized protein LOC104824221 isoform X2 [Tarenaya hassleriana]
MPSITHSLLSVSMNFREIKNRGKFLKFSVAMDSREIVSSEARKKLDCADPIEKLFWSESLGNHEHGSKCDLRKSLAWDSAFFTSPGVLDVEELFSSLNLHENEVKGMSTNKGFPSTSSDESSGRRSLAWNSAFFTDPGILNAEELFLVNRGISKRLPESKKQLWKSVDSSSSTSQRSRYSVTSIESDLFNDLRTVSGRSNTEHEDLSASKKRDGVREIQCKNGLRFASDEEFSDFDSHCNVILTIVGFSSFPLSVLQDSDSASAHKKLKPLPPTGRQRTNHVHRLKRVLKEPSRLNPQPKSVVCNGESNPLPSQKPDKFTYGSDATVAVSTNQLPSPLEHAKPKNGETGRNMRTLVRNRCSDEQTGSTSVGRSRRVVASRLTASDSSFKAPSRFAVDLQVPEKRSKTPTKPTTPLSEIALKDVRSSGLRLPLPKIGFFDAENAAKENREPNMISSSGSASRIRYRKSPQMASPDGYTSPLGRRKPPTLLANANAKCPKTKGRSETGTKRTDLKTHRSSDLVIEFWPKNFSG